MCPVTSRLQPSILGNRTSLQVLDLGFETVPGASDGRCVIKPFVIDKSGSFQFQAFPDADQKPEAGHMSYT